MRFKFNWFLNLLMLVSSAAAATNYNMSNSTVTTSSGNFYDSGGSAGNYSNNEYFTFTINPATAGTYVQVVFSSFYTDYTNDVLTIYDGANTSAPKLGTWSGNNSIGTITARNANGNLTFVFSSNGSVVYAGWAATISNVSSPGSAAGIYQMTASAVDTVTAGSFYDGGGAANNFSNSEYKIMTFYPGTTGQYMKCIFSSFATENAADFLYIYDGSSISAPLIAIYSGSTSPDTIVARNASGCLTFLFTSDAATVFSGWAATLSNTSTRGSNSGSYPMTNNAVDTVSGGRFYDSGGLLNNYQNNEYKTMTFYPGTTGQYITLNFSAFATEQSADYLYIYDGPDAMSTLLGAWSGANVPGTIGARNAAGCLTIKYTTDAGGVYAGWAATISTSSIPLLSSGNFLLTNNAVIHANGGNFYDRGGSSANYANNEWTTTTIYPESSGQYTKLKFSSFLTQVSTDFMYIYDGPSTSSPLLGEWSGSTSPDTITARNASGCLTILFASTGGTVYSGWAAAISYSTTPGSLYTNYSMTASAVDTVAGGYFYDMGGAGNNYANNEYKIMTFYPATAGYYMQANFSAFQTQLSNDKLSIYDGTSISAPLIGTFTGGTGPCTITATNSTGALTFVFQSTGGTVYSGWAATLSNVANACTNAGCFHMTNGATVKACNATFYDTGGAGNNYANSEYEVMTIYPTGGQFVQLVFSAFQTETNNDVLSIYDGASTSATLIGNYSGSTSPGTITATNAAGCLTVKFVSNGSTVYSGWTAAVNCTGAVNTVTWTGANSSEWSNAINWSNNCSVPSCTVSAVIPFTTNAPVIAADADVNNLTINSSATLTLYTGKKLNLCGNYTNNGTTSLAANSTIRFNGTGMQTISGNSTGVNKISNFTITKSSGTVTTSGDLDIGGDFTTSNSTSIFNSNGKYIKLSGNFTNADGSNTFTNSGTTGTLEFNGSSAQIFSPGTSVLTLNNVVMNHNGSGVTLTGNNMVLGASGILTLTNGKIITGANEVKINNTSPSSVSAGSSSSFVQGNLRRFINGSATAYDFPVGESTKGFQKAKITFTTTTTIPDVLARFDVYASTVPNGPVSQDCPAANYSLMPVLNNGYWTFTPSANASNGNYTINLYNLNYTNNSGSNGWTVLYSSSSPSTWGLQGNCVVTNTIGNTSRTGMSGFGYFGIGQTSGTLPVELLAFSGESEGPTNKLEWVTASERNNDFFTIEKSSDGKEFTTLTEVKGAGNSTHQLPYEFKDEEPFIPITYYRLKQTDFDGKSQTFKIIFVKTNNPESMQVFPNPCKGILNISHKGNDNETIEIKIINAIGAIVFSEKSVNTSNFFGKELSVDNFSPGEYIVQLTVNENEIYIQKVIVR